VIGSVKAAVWLAEEFMSLCLYLLIYTEYVILFNNRSSPMSDTKRTTAIDSALAKRMLTGVALWTIVAALCAVLANAVAAGLPIDPVL
jgi:hypothetical protein